MVTNGRLVVEAMVENGRKWIQNRDAMQYCVGSRVSREEDCCEAIQKIRYFHICLF